MYAKLRFIMEPQRPGKNNQARTPWTGLPGQPGKDSQDRTARTGQLGQDCQDS
jgi:hypothetical protein